MTGEILINLGFNMNFAPVVDVIDEMRAKSFNGLYSRAFGNSKAEVVEYVAAISRKFAGEGMSRLSETFSRSRRERS